MATEHLGNPYTAAKASITPGDPLSRMMGQYGKGHSYLSGAADPVSVAAAPGASPVRDAKGGMSKHTKYGGLGAGRMGVTGTPRDYAKNTDMT